MPLSKRARRGKRIAMEGRGPSRRRRAKSSEIHHMVRFLSPVSKSTCLDAPTNWGKMQMRRKGSAGASRFIRRVMGSIALTSVALSVVTGTAIAEAPAPGSEDPNNWPQYNRTFNAWRYSPLDQINKDNVGKLSVAWIAQGGDITMGIQETPLAIDGVIYSITAGNRVAALDGKTGRELWSFQPKLDPLTKKVLFSPYSRGVAVGHGMVFIGTVDGRGIALDQKTGKEKWQGQPTDF